MMTLELKEECLCAVCANNQTHQNRHHSLSISLSIGPMNKFAFVMQESLERERVTNT